MTSLKPSEAVQEIIPDILTDNVSKKRYQRGKFLGKVESYVVWSTLLKNIVGCVISPKVFIVFLGRVCEMLWTYRHGQRADFCRENRFQTASC